MGYELSSGDFFITMDGKTTPLGQCVPFTEEVEFSVSENPVHSYHLNDTTFSVNFDVSNINLSLLNNYCNLPKPNGKFTIEAQINIMTQARWHKKARIRKKWLKRFGMKPDTVKIKANATVGKYNTVDGSFDFETDTLEYLWRPDQLRNGLKIEF